MSSITDLRKCNKLLIRGLDRLDNETTDGCERDQPEVASE